MPLWTRSRLKRACLAALRSHSLTLKTKRKTDCSAELWKNRLTDRAVHIDVDPHQVGLIPGVVHELLHHVLDRQLLAVFSRTERSSTWELVMDTLEMAVVESILSSREETEKWRKAIDQKLSETSS